MIAHLFSGPRRIKDFQYYLDAFAEQTGKAVLPLSLDIIFGTHADFTDGEKVGQWRSWIRQRLIFGALGGPPCNTWSRGRRNGEGPGGVGPGLVRLVQALWARPGLSDRAARQVRAANLLLLAMLWTIIELAAVGGAGVLEHPDWFESESLPSIWQ